MLINKIFKEAEPLLEKRKINEVCIGLTIAAVSLDDGSIGTCLLLHEEMKSLSKIVFCPEEIEGMPAFEMAKWAADPHEHILKRSLGLAVLNACAPVKLFSDSGNVDASESVRVTSNDTVGFIGNIRGLVRAMEEKAKKVIVFDNGETEGIYPPETQSIYLPDCDVVYITGTAFANHTIDGLLDLCRQAREIIIVGPTTPMFPNAYKDSNVTVLAGGVWKKEHKQDIFARVALNAGIPSLSQYMIKQSIRVNK